MRELKILYEDRELIVVRKPPGMASQGEPGFAVDAVSLLQTRQKETYGSSQTIQCVHRLDKMVGGVVVYGKTKKAAASLSAQFAKHTVTKRYYAALCGKPEKPAGMLEDYLLRDKKSNITRRVSKETPGSKYAKLTYRVVESRELAYGEEGTLLCCTLADIELATGRHHQIRVQFAGRGLALYGDHRYNPQCGKGRMAGNIGLFGYELTFDHPVSGERMEFLAKPEEGIFLEFETFRRKMSENRE